MSICDVVGAVADSAARKIATNQSTNDSGCLLVTEVP
jgi:hypothetical protein